MAAPEPFPPAFFQLLAVSEERSHLGLCGPSAFCHCGEKGPRRFKRYNILYRLTQPWRGLPFHTCPRCVCVAPNGGDACALSVQVNIGILISVTRIISRISAESYKVHGDANAVK